MYDRSNITYSNLFWDEQLWPNFPDYPPKKKKLFISSRINENQFIKMPKDNIKKIIALHN